MHSSRAVCSLNLYFLQVRHEYALRLVIGVTDIVARNLLLPAN